MTNIYSYQYNCWLQARKNNQPMDIEKSESKTKLEYHRKCKLMQKKYKEN